MSTRSIILAAGFGSRLMPYTQDRPKCMVSLLGKTILDRQIDVMTACGIDHIGIVTGHCAEAVRHQKLESIFTNARYTETNMVESLICARDWLESGDDIIISYGDIAYEERVLRGLLSSPHDINVVVDREWKEAWSLRMDDPLTDAETMKISPSGTIAELGKKPRSYADIEGQYIGLQYWKAGAIADILDRYDRLDRSASYDGKPFEKMYMTSFIQILIDSGLGVYPSFTDGGWIEVDTVDDLKSYERLQEQGKLARIYDA